jgi:hypothetical protein
MAICSLWFLSCSAFVLKSYILKCPHGLLLKAISVDNFDKPLNDCTSPIKMSSIECCLLVYIGSSRLKDFTTRQGLRGG